MGMSESTLRIIVALVGGLIVVTRLYGVINPKKVKHLGGRFALLGNGWIRALYIIIGLLGIWILYSALVIIFGKVPVFLVVSFLIGLLFLLSGTFVIHPDWFPQIVRGLLVDRGDFFIRFLCVIGMLGGIFVLLTAIFGSSWGGG